MSFFKNNLKKVFLAFLGVLLLVGLAGCGGSKELKQVHKRLYLGDLAAVTDDIRLPKFVKDGDVTADVTWESENPDVIKIVEYEQEELSKNFFKGAVTRPEPDKEDVEVKLIAELTIGKKSMTKEFTATVKVMPETTTMTIKEAKAAAKGELVEVEGVIIYTIEAGFYIEDSTGAMYVYNSGHTYKVGDKVKVGGSKDIYYDMPQISGKPNVEVLGNEEVDYSKIATAITIDEIANADYKTNKDQYGQVFEIEGKLFDNVGKSKVGIKDITTGKDVAIYDGTLGGSELEVLKKENAYVKMTVVVYDHHSSGYWRVLYVPGTVEVMDEPELTDAEKVQVVTSELDDLLKGKTVFESIDLPTKGTKHEEVTIVWESDKPEVLSNTGVLGVVTEATTVTLTATITLGAEEKIVEYIVEVVPLEKGSVSETRERLVGLVDDSNPVWVEGIIIGFDTYGFFIADENAVLYVRDQKNKTLKFGDKVEIKGTGLYFYGVGKKSTDATQTTLQINGDLDDYELKVIESGLENPFTEVLDVTVGEITAVEKSVTATKETPFYGKLIKVTGKLVEFGDYRNLHLEVTEEDKTKRVVIYHNSPKDLYEELRLLVGSEVTLTLIPIDQHLKDGWRLALVESSLEGLAENLTEANRFAAIEAEINGIVEDNANVSGDLNFKNQSESLLLISNIRYEWETDKPTVIDATGKVARADNDEAVVITVKAFEGEATEPVFTKTINVTVLAQEEVVGVKVIINQVYGGGGNSGATYKNDFVELYNPTDEDIDLTGWTLQYASKTGAFSIGGDYPMHVELKGVIKAGKYYLIQLAAGNGGTKDLPSPDAIGGIAAAAKEGKFALANNNIAVTSPTDANVVDFVGYGPTANLFEGSGPAPEASNTKAIIRKDFIDTNDNKADFVLTDPNPRNSQN